MNIDAMKAEFRASLPDILEGRDPLDTPALNQARDRRAEYYRAKVQRIEARLANGLTTALPKPPVTP